MQKTDYKFQSNKRNGSMKIALASDFHNMNPEKPLEMLAEEKPDIITIPGDLIVGNNDEPRRWVDFLYGAVKTAPVFCSLGNHEKHFGEQMRVVAEDSGATLLDNNYVIYNGMAIGGLSSGPEKGEYGYFNATPKPELDWLDDFEREKCFKLLLCHHPEYYRDYLTGRDIDLIFAGHAHGGQIRLFGQGLFSPGQGLFPKLTSGIYDGRLIVSRGMKNNSFVPRLFNPTELVFVNLR